MTASPFAPPIPFDTMPLIARGVAGRVEDVPGRPLVIAFIAGRPAGQGHVGRFLDGLPAKREVMVPLVTSERLQGMLMRRGFWREVRYISPSARLALCWVRRTAIERTRPVDPRRIAEDAAAWGRSFDLPEARASEFEAQLRTDPDALGDHLAELVWEARSW